MVRPKLHILAYPSYLTVSHGHAVLDFLLVCKATYAAEMATVKEEVARKLPLIAEKAASEAGRYWRKRAEEETTALRTERDNRLRELQVRTMVFNRPIPR